MAEANSVSDTQVLLQSMLQRLRLQPKSEITRMQGGVEFGGTLIRRNDGAFESPPQTTTMHKVDFSIVSNRAGSQSPESTGVPTSLSGGFSQGMDVPNSRLASGPKQRELSWDCKSYHPVSGENHEISADDGVMPEQTRQQMNEGDSSVSSSHSPERFSSWTPIAGQKETNVQNREVEHRKWTQKVKEKWKERNKSSMKNDGRDTLDQTVSNSNISLTSVRNVLDGNSITTTFHQEVKVQPQPINTASDADIPSLLDHMSETLFSPGSFNLMEEIFTGQEWAKYLPSTTNNQSASGSFTYDREIGLTSSVSKLHQNDRNILSQGRDFREKTATDGGFAPSPINSEGFYTMDTSENALNYRKTQNFSQGSYDSQCRLSESRSDHMDVSGNPLENNRLFQEHTSIYLHHPSNDTEPKASSSSSSSSRGQNVHQSQTMEINPNQHGCVYEVPPVLDLSYLQSKVLLSRKRSHSTERSNSNDQWRWRNGSSSSTSDPAPSLSPASSTSSLQYSSYQDSESCVATGTVIKKRRVESTRHVRFAEEVTIVPPLILFDDEGDDEEDEPYGHNGDMIHGENDQDGEEPLAQPHVPRWIDALRSKTKKQKLKLLRMRTKKYHFM